MPALDLASIVRRIATSPEDVVNFIAQIQPGSKVGADTEGTGLLYPDCQMAGFSLYNKADQVAIYVPVRHGPLGDGNIQFTPELREALQRLFDTCTIVWHYGNYDMLYFVREGFRFFETGDTHILANMLQATNVGLKDLILEYGLVSFREVISYRNLLIELKQLTEADLDRVAKGRELEEVWSFADIDPRDPRAVKYACNDAIFCGELFEILCQEHDTLVADPVQAAIGRQSQFDTNALLSETAATGFLISREVFEGFIGAFSKDVERAEIEVMQQVRETMGWVKPAGGNLFESFGIG